MIFHCFFYFLFHIVNLISSPILSCPSKLVVLGKLILGFLSGWDVVVTMIDFFRGSYPKISPNLRFFFKFCRMPKKIHVDNRRQKYIYFKKILFDTPMFVY